MFDCSASLGTFPALGFDASETLPVISSVKQRTLKTSISCSGVGLHSGARIAMTLRPADPDTGVVFHRSDIAGRGATIAAHWSSVNDTRLNTCVGNDAGVSVRTIEHLMAALAGMGVDNVVIDINGPEVPVMDGSAAPFLFLIECAGVVEQSAPRRAVKVLKPVSVQDGQSVAMVTPDGLFSLSVEIDFPASAIRLQKFSMRLDSTAFKSEISRARTFGFEQEITALHAAGLAKGGSLDNAVVIASDGARVLNEEGLRYEDEFVRHKMLDAIGDLYLAGFPILGRFHGIRSGHAINNRLLRKLFADKSAWALVTLGDEGVAQRSLPPLRLVAASA